MTIVFVAFQVDADHDEAGEIVAQRLTESRVLWQNDSNDIINGTLDPIHTWAVIPLPRVIEEGTLRLLEESV
jgi:hypothetical protein